MYELDLIPDEYRKMLKLRIWLKLYAVFFVLLLVAIGMGKYTLAQELAQIKTAISGFENDKNTIEQQHQSLLSLEKSKGQLQNRVEILRTLRDGPPAQQMFVVMDKVLDKGTWFSRWSFMRAGEFKDVGSEISKSTLIKIVSEERKQKQDRAWKLNTHMQLNGQALDHTYLASFVNRLITQPEIDDVKVIKTSTMLRQNVDIVDFSLAVTVNNDYHL